MDWQTGEDVLAGYTQAPLILQFLARNAGEVGTCFPPES